MHGFLKFLLIWSEVWPFLIPLTIFFIFRTEDTRMHILVWYIAISFLFLFLANCITRYNTSLPESLGNNNILYNVNLVLRTVLAGGYLIYHRHLAKFQFLKYFMLLYLVFTVGIFIFGKPFSEVNVILAAATSIVLLTTCLAYFLNAILDDEVTITAKEPAFIISMGISIYEAINFFIYLFLYKLVLTDAEFGFFTMKLFMYSVIVYNIFFAFAFYYGRKKKPVLAI